MKKKFTLLVLLCVLAGAVTAGGNGIDRRNQALPVKPANPVLYCNDVVIHDDITMDQRDAALSIAFNGWVYSSYTVDQYPNAGLELMKSTDNGWTWNPMWSYITSGYSCNALDIVVCGTSESDLYLFQAGVSYISSTARYVVWVDKYDATSGNFINEVFFEDSEYRIYDVQIASDYKFPSFGASPYSIGILFSKTSVPADSLIFCSSADGGNTFTNRKVVSYSPDYMDRISLSFGRSDSYYNGRYFAAWYETSVDPRIGKTYMSNSDPYFDSDWLLPYRLDDLPGSAEDRTNDPVIACQQSVNDNDAGSFTTVVLFNRDYYHDGQDYDVIGGYNKISAGGIPAWTPLYLANTDMVKEFEADLNYDPAYDNFLVTYCDSTNQKLIYAVQGMDMPDPGNWWVIDDQYNDQPNLVNPYPKVEINPWYTQVGHVWDADRAGNGMAMWDAEYAVGTGNKVSNEVVLNVTPNPAKDMVNISFSLKEKSNVKLTVYDIRGLKVYEEDFGMVKSWRPSVTFNAGSLEPGYYSVVIETAGNTATGKLVIVR